MTSLSAGPLRLARAVLVAGTALGLAVGAHTLGGGSLRAGGGGGRFARVLATAATVLLNASGERTRRTSPMSVMSSSPQPVTSVSRLAARWLAAGVVALAALAVLAAPASAHNALRSVTPADGSTVEVAPETVDLVFDEPAIALGTQILVLGPDGNSVSAGEPILVDSAVSQPLAAERPAGTYTVQWRVTSADGHPISGQFTFSASSAAGVPAATPPSATPPVETPPSATPAVETPAPAPSDDATPAAEADAGGSANSVAPWAIAAGAAVVVLLAAGAIWWVRRAQS